MLTQIEIEDELIYNTPEKWYVRKKWLESSKDRLKIKKSSLKFFTLTSTGIYEINYFKDNDLIFMRGNSYLPDNLSFCEKGSHKFSIINKKLPGARNRNMAFEDLVISHGITIPLRVDEWFPFDIINLDFNESMFKQNSKFFDVIRKLLIIQKSKNNSFNLFLTLNLIENEHHDTNRNFLNKLLDQNLKNVTYKREFDKIFPNKFKFYNDHIANMVPKFIIEEGFKEGFDVMLKKSMIYTGSGNSTQMISFIFELNLQSNPVRTLHTIIDKRLLDTIKIPVNINKILKSNSKLSSEMNLLVKQYKC